jgi:hypothetical protein
MSKKELIFGAVITAFLAFWIIGIFIDAIGVTTIEPIISNYSTITIIGWIITIWLIGILLISIWAIWRTNNPAIENLKKRLTIRATIPGYFIVVIIPIMIGMGFSFLTGNSNWGGWLMCLSFPTLLLLTLITIRTHSNDR